jgi:hypothetical protein
MDRVEMTLGDGPQLTGWLTASGDTCLLAAANPSVSGSSAITGQPATDQRKKR